MTLFSWDIRKINFEVGSRQLNDGTVFDISGNNRFLSVDLLGYFIRKCISCSSSSVQSRHMRSSLGILGPFSSSFFYHEALIRKPKFCVDYFVPAICYINKIIFYAYPIFK